MGGGGRGDCCTTVTAAAAGWLSLAAALSSFFFLLFLDFFRRFRLRVEELDSILPLLAGFRGTDFKIAVAPCTSVESKLRVNFTLPKKLGSMARPKKASAWDRRCLSEAFSDIFYATPWTASHSEPMPNLLKLEQRRASETVFPRQQIEHNCSSVLGL